MANTIAEKLTYLSGTKGLIKEAIITKGVDVSDTDTFRSYADKISSIQSGGSGAANIPDGTKFAYSTFTTVPDSIIPYLETQNDMDSMFIGCEKLITVPLLNFSKVNKADWTFEECSSLTNLGGFTGLKVDLDLSSSPKLTIESVMNVINNAADMTLSPRTLTLHRDVFKKLSQVQIATASTKGWNIESGWHL